MLTFFGLRTPYPLGSLLETWTLHSTHASSLAEPHPFEASFLPGGSGGSIPTLAGIFCFSATVGLVSISAFQFLTSYGMLRVLFGARVGAYMSEFIRSDVTGLTVAEVQDRASMAREWRYWIFIPLFGFLCAGLPEEFLKYVPILFLRWRNSNSSSGSMSKIPSCPPHFYVNCATAAALGFSVVEAAGFIYAAIAGGETGWKLCLTIAERLLVGVPGHIITACLSAVRGWHHGFGTGPRILLSTLGPSICYHALWDSLLFGLSAWEGNVGWVHPTDFRVVSGMLAVGAGIQVVLASHVWRQWRLLNLSIAKNR